MFRASFPEERKRPATMTGWIVFLTVAACLLRIAYVQFTIVEAPVRADAAQYVAYALNLIDHGVFSKDTSEAPRPDSYRSPGYPAFLALCMLAGGQHAYQTILFAQAILSGVMVILTFWLGTTFLPAWGALTAATLVAMSPHLVTLSGYLLTETLHGFVLLLALLSFVLARRENSIKLSVVAGVCFGCAYLVNETCVVIPFVVYAAIMWPYPRSRRLAQRAALRPMTLFLAVFWLFPTAWQIRNALNVPPGAALGTQRALTTLSHGTYPGFVYKDPRYKYYPYKEDPRQPAFSSSFEEFSSVFWERFRERPLRYLSWYLVEKPYYVWSWSMLQGQGDVYVYPVEESLYERSPLAEGMRRLMQWLHPIVVFMAVCAFPLFWLRKNEPARNDAPLPLLVILSSYTAIHAVFFSLPRYAVPLKPELYLCALWALSIPASGLAAAFCALAHRKRAAAQFRHSA